MFLSNYLIDILQKSHRTLGAKKFLQQCKSTESFQNSKIQQSTQILQHVPILTMPYLKKNIWEDI